MGLKNKIIFLEELFSEINLVEIMMKTEIFKERNKCYLPSRNLHNKLLFRKVEEIPTTYISKL